MFDIEDGVLAVKNADACTMCRECIRGDVSHTNPTPVELGLSKDRFIFHVESVGVYKAEQLFTMAARVYAQKLRQHQTAVAHAYPVDQEENIDITKEDYL